MVPSDRSYLPYLSLASAYIPGNTNPSKKTQDLRSPESLGALALPKTPFCLLPLTPCQLLIKHYIRKNRVMAQWSWECVLYLIPEPNSTGH